MHSSYRVRGLDRDRPRKFLRAAITPRVQGNKKLWSRRGRLILPAIPARPEASDASGSVPARPADASQRIAFLRLRMVAGRVQLLGFQVKPGRLKSHANTSETLEIKVISPAGEMLWQGTAQNPLVRRLEWEDSTMPGRIRSFKCDAA